MTEKKCKFCKKIILGDWEKYLEEQMELKGTVWLQCPYCFELERIR